MSNASFPNIEDYNDMPTLNEYKHQKAIGGDLKKFMEKVKFECRDNGRTPFHWDTTANAGFSTGKPWLKMNPNYVTINQAAQENDPNSCLNYFRKITKLRTSTPLLVYGKYTIIDRKNLNIYAYTRELEGKKMLILLNFKAVNATVNTTGLDLSKAKVVLDNYSTPSVLGQLKPYEAMVLEL
jgi:oligo-1,6-glucosidase